MILKNFKKYLNENNYFVSTAINAEDAQEKVNTIKFDLIVLDIMMPGDNGLVLAKEVKKRDSNIKTIHFVAPQVWVWRKHRVKNLKSFLDHILLLFPFEKKYYEKDFFIKKIKEIENNIDQLDIDTLVNKYNIDNYVFALMNHDRNKLKVYLKTKFENNDISKNISYDLENFGDDEKLIYILKDLKTHGTTVTMLLKLKEVAILFMEDLMLL